MPDPIISAMILKTAVMAIQTIVMAYALIKFVQLSRKWRREAEEKRQRYIAYRWEAMEAKHRMEAEQSAREIESIAGVEAADRFYASVMSVYDNDETGKPKRKRSDRLALQDNQEGAIDSLPMWISQGGKMPRKP